MRVGDVYRFQYHMGQDDRYGDKYWCFDGQLVAKKCQDGLILVDTYWQFGDGSSGRHFTPDEARAQGVLTFVCNLDEVEEIKDGVHYYAEADVFNLSYQHGCYKRLMKRIGAPRDRDAMLAHLRKEMREAKADLDSAVWKIERLAVDLHTVQEAPDLEKVWI